MTLFGLEQIQISVQEGIVHRAVTLGTLVQHGNQPSLRTTNDPALGCLRSQSDEGVGLALKLAVGADMFANQMPEPKSLGILHLA